MFGRWRERVANKDKANGSNIHENADRENRDNYSFHGRSNSLPKYITNCRPVGIAHEPLLPAILPLS